MVGHVPGPAKGMRFGGRQKGTPNKATLERRAKQQAQIAADRNAPIENRELAKDALMRIAQLAEGAAAINRPTSPRTGNWRRFHDWVKLTAWCYKAAADFQSPKMLGVAVAPPPPVETDEPRVITLRVFEGGRERAPVNALPPPRNPDAA